MFPFEMENQLACQNVDGAHPWKRAIDNKWTLRKENLSDPEMCSLTSDPILHHWS